MEAQSERTKRWRQRITPHSNELKQSDTEEWETERRDQPDRTLKQKITSRRFFIVILWGFFLNQPRKHNSVSDTRQAQKRKMGRHREAYGTESTTRHSRHASWLPQVFAFTHEEHLNIKLLQKHVSALAHLSVTPLRLDNSTRPINEKPRRCANLPPISCLEHQTFPSTIFFFSITYEACHFPLPGAASVPHGCPNLPIWKHNSALVQF